MTQYQSDILQQFADDLYLQAASVVLKLMALWFFIGLLVGFGLLSFYKPTGQGTSYYLLAPTVVTLFVGYSIGSARAFALRLEAQRTLCQVAIERNTRQTLQIFNERFAVTPRSASDTKSSAAYPATVPESSS